MASEVSGEQLIHAAKYRNSSHHGFRLKSREEVACNNSNCSGPSKMNPLFSFVYLSDTNNFIFLWLNRMITTKKHFTVIFHINCPSCTLTLLLLLLHCKVNRKMQTHWKLRFHGSCVRSANLKQNRNQHKLRRKGRNMFPCLVTWRFSILHSV